MRSSFRHLRKVNLDIRKKGIKVKHVQKQSVVGTRQSYSKDGKRERKVTSLGIHLTDSKTNGCSS